MPIHTRCRICDSTLPEPFLDLGRMPLANSFLSASEEFSSEESFPLAVTSCRNCGLVQLDYVVPPERLYRHYLYVSSTAEAVRRYAQDLATRLVNRYRLGSSDLVVELGSNDGLVLKAFQKQGTRVLGIEPARNVAAIARKNGIPTVDEFFCRETARSLKGPEGPASVILGRHVFAHINDLHDFFEGVSSLLAPDGVLLIEVPYLGNLIQDLEFDTIYHEHLSYVSLQPMMHLCQRHGFQVMDVETVPLHGGSVFFSIQRANSRNRRTSRVEEMMEAERQARLHDPGTLQGFSAKVFDWKREFEEFIEKLARSDAHLIGYGAAAKANTLLNFCAPVSEHLQYILDKSPHKVGRFTPGTHRLVVSAESWDGNGASHMVILAWNFKQEIMAQMHPFSSKGGRFIIPIPRPEVV